MATSIKLTDEAKALLDRLQAELFLATGTDLTKQELLQRILERAASDKEGLLQQLAGLTFPLDDAQRAALDGLPVDLGVETDESTIDEVLYGGAPGGA